MKKYTENIVHQVGFIYKIVKLFYVHSPVSFCEPGMPMGSKQEYLKYNLQRTPY